jgi:hypothetical protein
VTRAEQRFAVGRTQRSQTRGAASPPLHLLVRQGCDEWVTYCHGGPATPGDVEVRRQGRCPRCLAKARHALDDDPGLSVHSDLVTYAAYLPRETPDQPVATRAASF